MRCHTLFQEPLQSASRDDKIPKDSVVPPGLVGYSSKSIPGTDVPGYCHAVPDGTAFP